jgi:type I restriction enzyme S subunit
MGTVADWGSGGTPSRGKSEYYGGDIPWATISDLPDGPFEVTNELITSEALQASSTKLVPPGSVLIAMYGASIGKLGLPQCSMATNQAIAFAAPFVELLDRNYLFRFLQSQKAAFVSAGVGGAQPNISQNLLKTWKIPLPPLPEQRRIAAILDHADVLRVKRREALAQLEELTQAIFIDLFGDPATNPQQLPVVTIGEMLDSANYGTSEKSGATGKFPVLRMGNITYQGQIDLTDLKYMDLEDAKVERFTVRAGDVVFNRTNSPDLVGKTAVYRGAEPLAYAGYLVRLRAKDDSAPEYISAFLNSRYGKAVLRGMCKSIVGMANINAREVQSIKIPQPATVILSAFNERVAAVEQNKAQHRTALTELDDLFASIQSRAFRGEL